MIEFSAAQIADLTHGTLSPGTEPTLVIDVAKIATDSRDVVPGSLYVAKAGEQADGHDYIGAAFSAGAVLTLAERAVAADDAETPFPAVIVADAGGADRSWLALTVLAAFLPVLDFAVTL